MDEVFLEGLRFYGYHGVNPEERAQGQRFIVDVRVTTDLRRAGRSDDLNQTVSYSDVAKLAREIVEGEPRRLIESVAEAIADAVLAGFPLAAAVAVTVRKPQAPIKGIVFDAAGVSIVRSRLQP